MLHTLPRNPFATRHTQPGAVAPLDAAGRPIDVAQLTASIEAHRGAAIEGPHGTGKSTLLKAIATEFEETGRPVKVLRLRAGREAWTALHATFWCKAGTIVGIDGWEVLGPLRGLVRSIASWREVPLVVTTHRATGFAFTIRTTASIELLKAIVERLPDHGGLIEATDLLEALERHPSNIREALYDLYDHFERRTRFTG